MFGVLASVFEALYIGVDGQTVMVEKKDHYQWLYSKAVERLNVKIDSDGDNEADVDIRPGVVKLGRE